MIDVIVWISLGFATCVAIHYLAYILWKIVPLSSYDPMWTKENFLFNPFTAITPIQALLYVIGIIVAPLTIFLLGAVCIITLICLILEGTNPTRIKRGMKDHRSARIWNNILKTPIWTMLNTNTDLRG